MEKLANKIQKVLLLWANNDGRDIVVPNFFFENGFEFDVFRLSFSGMVSEFEIKTTKADFKNDFKKSKRGVLKHDLISSGNYKANYFTFVVPEGLIGVKDIPKHAGLIYFKEKFTGFEVVKRAPTLRPKFIDDSVYQRLARALYFRYSNYKFKSQEAERTALILRNRNKELRELLAENGIKLPAKLKLKHMMPILPMIY